MSFQDFRQDPLKYYLIYHMRKRRLAGNGEMLALQVCRTVCMTGGIVASNVYSRSATCHEFVAVEDRDRKVAKKSQESRCAEKLKKMKAYFMKTTAQTIHLRFLLDKWSFSTMSRSYRKR